MGRRLLGAAWLLITCAPDEPVAPEDVELVYARSHGPRGAELRGASVGRPDVVLIERQAEQVSVRPESWSLTDERSTPCSRSPAGDRLGP